MKKIRYAGNKGTAQIIPQIINLLPPMKRYIELCLGSGGPSRHIRLPLQHIGVEKDSLVIKKFAKHYPPGMVVINDCAISWLEKNMPFDKDTVIYADPPYLKSSRRSTADIYNYEWSNTMHSRFLHLLKRSSAVVVISGYPSVLYDRILKGWNKKTFKTSVHGKVATEVLWYNFKDGGELHQYNYLGKNKTDRQRIKRKIARHVSRLKRLPLPERNAIIEQIKIISTFV